MFLVLISQNDSVNGFNVVKVTLML